MADELFDVRNLFTLGNYAGAVNAAISLRPSSSAVSIDRDVYLYRCYICQRNYGLVLAETEGEKGSDPSIAAVRTLALYKKASGDSSLEKEPIEAMFNNKKFEVDGVFEINDNDEYDVYIASPTDEVETSVPENKEEVVNEEPTDLIPINDDAEDGDDEEEISQEEVENTDTDDEEEVPPPPPGPHHGTPPDVKPEVPKITPGKPTKPNQHEHPGLPNKPWKFGYPSKPKNPIYPGKQGILHSINKLFEENKDHHSNPAHEPANLYMPIKKWIMKKSNYVVSKELLAEDLEEAQEIIEEVSVPNSFIDDDIPAETIKLNNPDNHRDNNDEEEVFEIGSKKVSYINSSHPVKPTLNFRKSDEERRDTH